jgi:hypothetical protein
VPGCIPLLRDPLNRFWALNVLDTGQLQTTLTAASPSTQNNPILIDANGNQTIWQVSINTSGQLLSTRLGQLPTLQPPLTYLPLASVDNLYFKLTILPTGQLQTLSTSTLLPDVIPYVPNVTMSVYGTPITAPVTCPTCNNAVVIVSADESCWCCTCSAFVLPENTTMIVILDE